MAQQQQHQQRSRADRLKAQWLSLRREGSILYDVLLWQDMTWPILSLAWLPQAATAAAAGGGGGGCWAQPPGVAAAEAAAQQRRQQDYQHQQQLILQEQGSVIGTANSPQQQPAATDDADDAMAVDEPPAHQEAPAAAAAGAGSSHQQQLQQQQLLPMPVEYHYLLTGSQTSGNGRAHVDLYRVEVPGVLPAGAGAGGAAAGAGVRQPGQQQQQQVLMQKGDLRQVMRICHGVLDVNRLAVMPQQPNIMCTCCDQPEVFLFDLRQHVVQEWAAGAAAAAGAVSREPSEGGEAEGDDDGGEGGGSSSVSDDAGGSISDEDADALPSDSESLDDAAAAGEPPNPQAVLTGRRAGGFALAFNPTKPGLLLGADLEGGVQLWDVAGFSGGSSSSNGNVGAGGGDNSNGVGSSAVPRVSPLQSAEGFVPCAINDVSWHRGGTAYALATEQGEVWVQDLRNPLSTQPSSISTAGTGAGDDGSSSSRSRLTQFVGPRTNKPSTARIHVRRSRQSSKQRQQQQQQGGGVAAAAAAGSDSIASDCFCVAFDPCNDHRLASGGADGYVNILDTRKLSQPVDQLGLHAGSVTSVAWSHSLPGLLASAGEDGAVMLWDANKLQHAARFAGGRQQQQGQNQQQLHVQDMQGALGLPAHRQVRAYEQSLREHSLPGLLFMHGGHFGAVGGLALNPHRPWLLASSTGCVVEAPDSSGQSVVIQRQPVMVWQPNTAHGLLC